MYMQDNIFLSPHFCLKEFTESPTAEKYGIVNEPTPEMVANLKRLCLGTLEPLREALDLPVIITSGYRCKALNDIISHHANHSQHLVGCAADFYIGWRASLGSHGQQGSNLSHRERLIKAFRLIIENEEIDYVIIYPSFLHVSYVSPEANRHYIMVVDGNGRFCRVTPEVDLSIN